MNNVVYVKAMKKLRNRIDVRIDLHNKKDYFKWTSKPAYMSQAMFDNDLVAIRKSKVALGHNKPAYAGMCILNLSKVLVHELHYGCIKKKCGDKLRLLFTHTDRLMDEIKTEDVYKRF